MPAAPYRGINAFRYVDHEIFLAREEEVQRLASLVSVYRGTMLYGETGTGKSSLVNAGLLPRLVELGFRPERLRVQPRRGEELVLERIVTAEDDGGWLPSLLAGEDDALPRVVLSTEEFERRVGDACAEHRPLIVFDQFEELCTLFATAEEEEVRRRIVELLMRLLHATLPVKLLFVFRDDYLGRVKELLSAYPDLVDQALQLTPLTADALPTIVSGPFARHPGRFDHELVGPSAEQLCTALAERFGSGEVSLTEVQTVCLRLWQSDEPAQLLASRGVQGILEDYLGEALDVFPPRLGFAAVALLGQMVTAAGTRNVVSADDLVQRVCEEDHSLSPELVAHALERLERESRLVRREHRRNLDLYEITSEFLVPWISRRRTQVRRQRERRRDRRRLLLLGAAVAVLALFAAGVSILAALAIRSRADARAAATKATALALTAASVAQRDDRLDLSLLLATGAYDLDPGLQERDGLLSVLTATRTAGITGILHGPGAPLAAVAFSRDGALVATGGIDKAVRLWDVRSRRQLGAPLQGNRGQVAGVAFSPDGTLLASAGWDDTIRLWDVQTRRSVAVLRGHRSDVESVAFSPDGRLLASGADDETVRVWSVRTHRQLAVLSGHDDIVNDVAFSPDGTLLASAGWDDTIRLWDVQRRRSVAVLRGHRSDVESVAFSPDGRLLASGADDETVRVWSVRTHRQLARLRGHHDIVNDVAFSPLGRTLVSASWDGTVRLWNARTRRSLGVVSRLQGNATTDLAFSPDGRTLASANWDGTVSLGSGTAENGFGTPLAARAETVGDGDRWTGDVTFSPDGRLLASAGWDDLVRLWDVRRHVQLGAALRGHRSDVESVAFSPDGRLLASGADDETVRLWDVRSHRQLALLTGHRDFVFDVAFSPDGTLLASAGHDGRVLLWDVRRRERAAVLRADPRAQFQTVAFSPDGRTLASGGSDRVVRLWDVRRHRQRRLVGEGHVGIVTAVAFSPDGATLAVAGDAISLWDVDSGRQVGWDMGERQEAIDDLAFTPRGDMLVVAVSSGTGGLSLWNVAYRTRVGAPMRSVRALPTAVAISPDGTKVASGADDGSVRLWGGLLWRRFDDLKREVCRIVGTGISRPEWRRYVPSVEYRQICPG